MLAANERLRREKRALEGELSRVHNSDGELSLRNLALQGSTRGVSAQRGSTREN